MPPTLFWADDHSADQQLEAVASIATHMKFRPRSVVGLPLDKKARVPGSSSERDRLPSPLERW